MKIKTICILCCILSILAFMFSYGRVWYMFGEANIRGHMRSNFLQFVILCIYLGIVAAASILIAYANSDYYEKWTLILGVVLNLAWDVFFLLVFLVTLPDTNWDAPAPEFKEVFFEASTLVIAFINSGLYLYALLKKSKD